MAPVFWSDRVRESKRGAEPLQTGVVVVVDSRGREEDQMRRVSGGGAAKGVEVRAAEAERGGEFSLTV